MSVEMELAAALERAEKAERREEQFRNWWTGVSKQLDDLRRQYAAEDWARAESCEEHGRKIKNLDDQLHSSQRRSRETEEARVTLVVGLQVLQDIVRAHRAGRIREDLTVGELMAAMEGIVWRTLGQTPETEKRPVKAIQLSLFEPTEGAA